MNIQNLNQETAGYRDAAVKAVSVQYIICTIIISQAIVLWLSAKGPLFPGEERFLSIIGTCAEIIAGLYGITMAASQEICVLARRILSFLEGGPVEEDFLKFYHK